MHLLPLFAYPAWEGMRYLFARRMGRVLLATALGFGLFSQLCAMVGSDRVEYLQVLPSNNIQGGLPGSSGASVYDAPIEYFQCNSLGGEDVESKILLNAEFGSPWGLRLARNLPPSGKAPWS